MSRPTPSKEVAALLQLPSKSRRRLICELAIRREQLQFQPWNPPPPGYKRFWPDPNAPHVPRRLVNGLRRLATVHGARLTVRERIPRIEGYGSYCSLDRNIIIVVENGFIGSAELVATFCHELAHHLQYKFYGVRRRGPYYTAAQILDFEREACKVAYQLYRRYFPGVVGPNGSPLCFRSYFDGYRSKRSIKHLLRCHRYEIGEEI